MKHYVSLLESGEQLYENKDFAGALKCFEKLYVLNPSNTNANYMACCYIGMKDFEKAEKLLVSLVDTCHWETIYYNLARVYIAQKRFDNALDCLNEAISINSENDACFFYLGVFYDKTNEYEKAIKSYKQAVQLSDDFEDISMYLNNIGLCYYKIKDWDNALCYFNLALEKDESNNDAKYNIKLIMDLKAGEDYE